MGGRPVKQRKMKLIHVEVQHIKPRGHAAHFVKHDHEVGNVIAHRPVEPKGLLAAGDKPCTGQRITTGKQGDVVSLLDELLGEI